MIAQQNDNLQLSKPCNRHFRWVSSVEGDPLILANLDRRMASFYGQPEDRDLYQQMLETQEAPPDKSSVRYQMPRYVVDLASPNILEVGCGSGRLYRQLRQYGFVGQYSGIEVADYLIQENRQRHSDAVWQSATAYDIPFADAAFDTCFSLNVLEHLVYPERGLIEMMRILKPGGKLVLAFPDFAATGHFASQMTGLRPGRAGAKLRQGQWLDVLIGLYDSRIRLPRALKQACLRVGQFPVNTAPLCLSHPSLMSADVDAIYIASKTEVYDWANNKGYAVQYPSGTEGEFARQAFLVIEKTHGS